MTLDENNVFRLKYDHDYYYQVQGQMLLTGLRWADFVVCIDKSNEITLDRVIFDPQFCYEMYLKSNIYEAYMKDTMLINCI